jgi:hypothetical protein
MKAKSKMIRTAASYLFVMCILGEMFGAASTTVDVSDKTIASKRTGSIVIALTNDTGKLTPGENHFCILFQRGNPAPAGDIGEVSVDFRLLVGRIQEEPITANLDQNGADRYCGRINLGAQYYHPASYYAFVRYVEATGKKRSARLFLTVK